MKFSCSNCKARYQLPDEKVAGRALRMNCRQCKAEIIIRGDGVAPGLTLSQAPVPMVSMRPESMPSPRMDSRLSIPRAAPAPLGASLRDRISAAPPAVPPPLAASPPALSLADAWHVGINDVAVGPMRRDEVGQKISLGAIGPESLCWREGMEEWKPLRQIPELVALFGSLVPPAPEPVAAPPLPIHAAAGRVSTLSATPRWSAAPPEPGLSHVPPHATSGQSVIPPVPGAANWAKMFAMAGGLALLMTATVIFGVKYLSSEPQPVAPSAVTTPASPQPVAAAAKAPKAEPQAQLEFTLDEVEEDTEPTEEQDTDGDERRAAGAGSRVKKPTAPTKTLTAAQKEMLSRMGGGLDSELALLQAPAGARKSGSSDAAKGSLTAAQLNQVRLRGQENLKRCYESALRSSGGSSETLRMDVELTISPSGNVTNVDATGSALAGMDTCIERTVRMWRFPSSGETTQTKFPVVFQPGG